MNDLVASHRRDHQPSSRAIWSRLAWVGLLLLAFALRLYHLSAQSLWYDEGVSWHLTQLSLPALTVWTANDIQPPLYYYLLWVWVRLAGTSEYALRFPSAVFGLLTLPLLWITARRLLGNSAAWLAALFLTLSPLHVYYAQETRMYTLLTFLGLLSSYLWLRCVRNFWDAPGAVRPGSVSKAKGVMSLFSYMPWAYVVVTVAALYTHYFAFFLLAAHLIFFFHWGWKQARSRGGLKWSITGAAPIWLLFVIPLAILILYLPWIPFLLTRYGQDTSYWAGTLKLGEVARKLFIAFSLGETVTEQIGAGLVIGYGVILLVGLVTLLVRGRRQSVAFLLLYLVIPPLLVLLLTYRTPKFNPRYAMLASPAFILLLAGGLSSLVSSVAGRVSSHNRHRLLRSPSGRMVAFYGLIATGFILGTSIYSLRNWFLPYPVNQFNKADFRITAQIVRERIRPNETVLLNSGHMFPAWAYYYGWEGWHRLPDIEILDVNAALDLSVGDALDRFLEGKQGVWLVRWQNEVTDPFDVLPLYLGTIGIQDDYGQFWHMELAHYSLPPDAHFDVTGFIAYPAEVDFGGKVRLLGKRQTVGSEVILFWQAIDSIEADYTIFVHLLDATGARVANADHLPLRPTREWRPGQIIPDRVKLDLPDGITPGDYQLEVGLYNADDPTLPRLPVEFPVGGAPGDRAILPFKLEANDLD